MGAIYRDGLQNTYRGIVSNDWLNDLNMIDAIATWRRFFGETEPSVYVVRR